MAKWNTRYGLVGIYNPESAATEFEPQTPTPLSARVLAAMESKVRSAWPSVISDRSDGGSGC